jgi:hypothetical protein
VTHLAPAAFGHRSTARVRASFVRESEPETKRRGSRTPQDRRRFSWDNINPARLERWALWGFAVGVLDAALTSTHGSPIHGMGSAITAALAMGAGGSVLALFLAGLWNSAGRTR